MSRNLVVVVFAMSLLISPPMARAQLRKAGIAITPNIPYGGRKALMDFYYPVTAKGPVPVVLWIHGGGWKAGDKESPPAIFLAGKGFAVASISYRLSQDAPFPAQIQDCKAAVRYLRANAKKFGIDPDRIGAWGASAGGHLSALLGTSGDVKDLEGTIGGNTQFSSRVQAVCDWFGPTDLESLSNFKSSQPGLPSDAPMQMISQLFGGSIKKSGTLVKNANPITHISAQSPPFLIMHGDRDALVPLSQSQLLADALRTANVPVQLQVIPGAGHGLAGMGNFNLVEEFFTKHLGSKEKDDEKEGTGMVRLVATALHQAGKGTPGTIRFYSNGYLGSPSGPNTWVRNDRTGTITLYSYNEKAPKGMWVDSCILTNTGYMGKNQNGVAIRGVWKAEK